MLATSRRIKSAHILVGILGLQLFSFAFAAPADDYRQGMEAFNVQRYESALQYFTAARRAGMNSPTLTYNLGSVYFRLGRLDESLAEYGLLAEDPSWGALAHYNMGLIEEARQHTSVAVEHYRLAYDRAGSPRLKALAAAKLNQFSTTAIGPAEDQSWSGVLSLSGGYDDNVLLNASDIVLADSGQDAYFTELRALASGYIQGGLAQGWRMDLSGYYRAYSKLSDNNLGVGNAGLLYSRLFTHWYLETGGKIEAQFIGSQYLTTIGRFNIQALRPLGAFVIRLRNEASYYQPGSAYEFIGGWQNRTGVDFTHRFTNARIQLGYELELNKRDDLAQGQEFFSYSPQRHKVFVNFRQYVADKLQLEAQVDYRTSRYNDENVQLNQNGSLTRATRNDDRFNGFARMTYQASRVWNWFVEYQYLNNDSNFGQYSYVNNQANLGFERSF